MFTAVRVQDIIMDEKHKAYTGPISIGTILYTDLDTTIIKGAKAGHRRMLKARPLFHNISHYPVSQEIVYITPGPSKDYMSTTRWDGYYMPPIGIWGDPANNGIPTTVEGPESNLPYEGEYYKSERLVKIRPLRPYEGDITYEGRYGQSIRFGSTIDNSKSTHPNRWSNEGEIGNPITIIRNGQYKDVNKQPYSQIEEDINKDHSSIYLCSNQQITGFTPASTNDASYGTDIFKDVIGIEANPTNDIITSNITEDISLTTANNLPPVELQKTDELALLNNTEAPYYDISETESQAINSNDDNDITSNNIVPDNINVNTLNQTLG
tara:strand:- start:6363 stop:7334 length:972 start_codon:yes stop_codon:yes gene_type:complete